MLPQDNQIDIFLFNPSEELFSVIADKDLALDLLKELPDSAQKSYFLWQRDVTSNSRVNIMEASLREGNSDLFFTLLEGVNSEALSFILERCTRVAAEYGRLEELKVMLKGNRDHKLWLIKIAIERDHMDIVDYLVSIENNNPISLIMVAADCDRRDLVERFFNMGADEKYIVKDNSSSYRKAYQKAEEAAKYGYKDLVDEMIEKGASNYSRIAYVASHKCRKEIIDDMIERMGRIPYKIVTQLAYYGHMEYMLELTKKCDNDWDEIANYAARGGQREIVEYISSNHGIEESEEMLQACIFGGLYDIAIDILECEIYNWYDIIEAATECGNRELLDLVMKKYTNSLYSKYGYL